MNDLVNMFRRERWMDQGLCAQTDPESFFPAKGGTFREAIRVCEGCPVRAACLDYALRNDEEFGIWGGFSRNGRLRLLAEARARRRAAAPGAQAA